VQTKYINVFDNIEEESFFIYLFIEWNEIPPFLS